MDDRGLTKVKAAARRLDNKWTLTLALAWLIVFFGQIVNSMPEPMGWGASASAYAPTSHAPQTTCPTAESQFQVQEEGAMLPVAN